MSDTAVAKDFKVGKDPDALPFVTLNSVALRMQIEDLKTTLDGLHIQVRQLSKKKGTVDNTLMLVAITAAIQNLNVALQQAVINLYEDQKRFGDMAHTLQNIVKGFKK